MTECPECSKALHAHATLCKCGWKLRVEKKSVREQEQHEMIEQWARRKKAAPEVAAVHLQKMYAALGRQRRVA